MSKQTERPILFSPQMVKALLRDKNPKTETRRISGLNEYNGLDGMPTNYTSDDFFIAARDVLSGFQSFKNNPRFDCPKWDYWDDVKCPYGKPGDILWVRESFYSFGYWEKNTKGWSFIDCTEIGQYRYMDNPPPDNLIGKRRSNDVSYAWYKRPSIHMPYRANRIKLRVVIIRAERLHDITEASSIREGVDLHKDGATWLDYEKKAAGNTQLTYCCPTAKDSFRTLWCAINGRSSWISNPWVWVVRFEKV